MAKNIEKKPPQDIESEECLLGSLMIDPDAIYKVSDFLLEKDFYKDKHKKIYEAILDLFSKSEKPDILNVKSRLKEKDQLEEVGARAYLTQLVNSVPTASHVLDYARRVQEKRVLRDLISASEDIAQLGYDEERDVNISLDEAEKKIFSISEKSYTQTFTPINKTLEETFERIEELSESGEGLRGVPTGFKDLDNKLSGLQKSDLVILAARPSLGKSALAVDMVRNVAKEEQKPVGIFSLEMSKDQVIDRMIAAEANIDLWKLRTGKLSQSEESNDFQKIQKAMDELSQAPIFIDDLSGSTVLQMRAMARRLQAEHGLGLLVIDYLQLMEHRESDLSIVQQVTENSRALKSLAKELDVPVLVLSQLSRAVEKRTPQIPRLSDLRQSGCLTGDSLITRADTGERVPIKELVGEKDIPVYSLGDDWQVQESKISKVFCSGKKMTYELTLRSGRKIKASGNHPFRKKDGWEHLDNLNAGELLAIPKKNNGKICEGSTVDWDKIISIKSLEVEKVYDATVLDNHNFVANDIIVHNSIEQDADVVLFIHREDKYKEDTDKQNIADIIVAKHRNGPVGKVQLYFDEPIVSFRSLEKDEYEDYNFSDEGEGGGLDDIDFT